MQRGYKTGRIGLRLTPREKSLVELEAERREMTVSEYCRAVLVETLRKSDAASRFSFGA